MRVPSNLRRGSPGFNMTPMIDVVFLLIIFFLVSSHLAQQETRVDLKLPAAGSGTRPEEDRVRRMVVNVLPVEQPAGRIMVSGRLVRQQELAEMIDFETSQPDGRLEVRIRTDRTVPYRVVEPVMTACARAGVWKVTFAVVHR